MTEPKAQKILGISSADSPQEVIRAVHKLMREHHPDTEAAEKWTADEKEFHAHQAREVNEAYNYLKDLGRARAHVAVENDRQRMAEAAADDAERRLQRLRDAAFSAGTDGRTGYRAAPDISEAERRYRRVIHAAEDAEARRWAAWSETHEAEARAEDAEARAEDAEARAEDAHHYWNSVVTKGRSRRRKRRTVGVLGTATLLVAAYLIGASAKHTPPGGIFVTSAESGVVQVTWSSRPAGEAGIEITFNDSDYVYHVPAGDTFARFKRPAPGAQRCYQVRAVRDNPAWTPPWDNDWATPWSDQWISPWPDTWVTDWSPIAPTACITG